MLFSIEFASEKYSDVSRKSAPPPCKNATTIYFILNSQQNLLDL